MEREKPVIVLNRMRLVHSAARPIRTVAPREYRPAMAAPFRQIPVLGPAKADFAEPASAPGRIMCFRGRSIAA